MACSLKILLYDVELAERPSCPQAAWISPTAPITLSLKKFPGRHNFPLCYYMLCGISIQSTLVQTVKQLWALVEPVKNSCHQRQQLTLSQSTMLCSVIILQDALLPVVPFVKVLSGFLSLCCDSFCLCTTGAKLKRSLNEGAVLFSCNREICQAFQLKSKI